MNLTPLEYQQCLMSLPNPEKGRYPNNRVRIAVVDQNGERKVEYSLKYPADKAPVKLAEIKEVEFELCFERPIPFWQPVNSIIITPFKRHEI